MTELDATTHELAMEFGGLKLLRMDMDHARALFERLAEMPVPTLGDFRLSSALWISGLITYRRCFAKGAGIVMLVPQRFIDALDPEQRELHEDVLHMADKFISHRVTDHHQVEVWFEVEHGPPPRVRSVRARQILLATRTNNAFELASLARHLAHELEAECDRTEKQLVASANAADVLSWFTPATDESPEWVNILRGEADPILGNEVVAETRGETR
jgi:hypothetical protein